jgi:hypothetical protein
MAGVSLGEVFGQALPHTHRPFVEMLDFLTSPGGGLLWDLFLLALGIFFTVVILQRYFERQEEKRWRPARQDLYQRLFSHANWLIKMLPSDVQGEWPSSAWYQFGQKSTGGRVDVAFSRSIRRLDAMQLKDVAEGLIDDPSLLEGFEQNVDATLQGSAAIFLARDPDLNRIVAELREWITRVKRILEACREVRGSGMDPAVYPPVAPVSQQACVQLRELIITANIFQSWLAARADEIRPSGPDRRA